MLYRLDPTAPRKPSLIRRIMTAIAGVLGELFRRQADTQYLDGLRPQELEDLGLRRTDARDYTTFR